MTEEFVRVPRDRVKTIRVHLYLPDELEGARADAFAGVGLLEELARSIAEKLLEHHKVLATRTEHGTRYEAALDVIVPLRPGLSFLEES